MGLIAASIKVYKMTLSDNGFFKKVFNIDRRRFNV
jgi:hypothetical protein